MIARLFTYKLVILSLTFISQFFYVANAQEVYLSPPSNNFIVDYVKGFSRAKVTFDGIKGQCERVLIRYSQTSNSITNRPRINDDGSCDGDEIIIDDLTAGEWHFTLTTEIEVETCTIDDDGEEDCGTDSFNSESTDPITINVELDFEEIIVADFENNLGYFHNTASEDWTINSGRTTSSNTGPREAFEGNSYAYMETSSGSAFYEGDQAIIELDTIENISSRDYFAFNYLMFGTDIGELDLQLKVNNVWKTIWSNNRRFFNDVRWGEQLIQLERADGLRFVATAKGGYQGDTAIDNVRIYRINRTPNNESLLAPENVKLEINGNQTIVSWNDVENAFEFHVQVLNSSSQWENIAITSDLSIVIGNNLSSYEQIRILACNGNSCVGDKTISSTVSIKQFKNALTIDRTQHKAPYRNNHEDSVGELQGNFNVNASGAASYNIPIMLPKGVAEATPSVSLNYNSNGGNGLLGKGWSIGGASSITRCGQDYIRDGQITGIQWNNEDRFCLNGSRLILTSGSYGGVNARYTSEIESNNIITSVGGSFGHPSYFTLTAKDGSVTTYGGNSGARQLNGDATYKWAISNKADIGGNNISYTYTNNTNAGTFKLNRINYSVYSVQFNYITQSDSNAREDIQTRLMTGYQYVTEDLLESISVKNGSATLRNYYLEYKAIDTVNRTSKIEAIQECSARACFPKTRFDWSDDNFGLGDDLTDQGEFDDIVQIKGASTGDFNGDGISDLVLRLDDSPTNGARSDACTYRYYLGGPNGLTQEYESEAPDQGCAAYSDSYYKPIVIDDFNQDGRSDTSQLFSYSNTGNWNMPNQVTDTVGNRESAGEELRFFDVNRDGIPDKVVLYNGGREGTSEITGFSSLYIILGEENTLGANYERYVWNFENRINLHFSTGRYIQSGLGFYDVTGDGAFELVVLKRDNFVNLSRTSQFRLPGSAHVFDFPDDIENANNMQLELLIPHFAPKNAMFADINGDGVVDVIAKVEELDIEDTVDGIYFTYKITGIDDEFTDLYSDDGIPQSSRGDLFGDTEFSLIDYDKDGKLDIYIPGQTTLLWRGDRFVPHGESDRHGGAALFIQDFTGDGILDLVALESKASSGAVQGYYRRASFYKSSQASEVEGRIKTITTGTGYTTEINYEQLALTSHYKPFDINADGPDEIQDSLCIYLSYSHCAQRYSSGAYNANSFYDRLAQGPLLPETNSDSLNEQLAAYKPVTGGRSIVASVTSSNRYTQFSNPGYVRDRKKTIDYYYGRAFSNGYRGSVGFETMTKVDNDASLETQSVYRQDFPFVGRATLEQVRMTNGRVLSTTYTDWGMNISEKRLNDVYQLYPKNVVVASHDPDTGDLLKVMETHSSINGDGHIEESIEQTKTAYGSLVKSVTNTVSYDGSSAVCNARGLPSFQAAEHYLASSGTSKTLETSLSYYNNCQLERQTVEPNKSKFTSTMTYTYDRFGNAERIISSAPNLSSRSARMVYDPSGRYVRLQYNAKNQLVQIVTAVNSYGQPTVANGLNGAKTTMAYDSFGREIYQSTNDGNWSASAMQWCDVVSDEGVFCPSGAIMRSAQTSASGAVAYQYTNVLGQVVRSSQLAFDGNRFSIVDSEYDNEGELTLQSLPYYFGDTTYWTYMNYDIINREILTRNPDGSESKMDYDGFTTTYINDLNQTKIETINEIGELIEVEDHHSGKVVNTYTVLGNLSTATSMGSNSDSHDIMVEIYYDHLGRKSSMNDPDKGTWQYVYNAYGEMMSQTNAEGEKTLNTYDVLGRMEKRVDYQNGSVANTTRWYFDGATPEGAPRRAGNALSLLSAVVHSKGTSTTCNNSQTEYCQSFSYDNLGRPSSETKTLGASGNHGSYTTTINYDSIGRVLSTYDAYSQVSSNTGTYNHYNAYGYPLGISNISGTTYEGVYLLQSMNASGQVTASKRGNNVTTNYTYNPETTRIEQQLANGKGAHPVQDISYEWDTIGNLRTRANYSGRSVASYGYTTPELRETFCYDSLNRLTGVAEGLNSSCGTAQVRYNSIGNITYKEGVGNYTYGQRGAGPHAVTRTSVGSIDYDYDANGNLTRDDEGRRIEYTVFDKPSSIYKDGHITQFYYGPDRARWKRVDIDKDSNTTVTLYLGTVEKVMKENDNGRTKITWERYLSDFALYSATTSDNNLVSLSRKYLYKDYQGSVDVITDETGKVITLMSFDAWGKRRNGYEGKPFDTEEELVYAINQQIGEPVKLFSITNKGYTGHEMLDEVGLIHMNGRVYNPNIARFVSADPLISRPDDTQSYNRYSYVSNRPMFYTDPSGFSEDDKETDSKDEEEEESNQSSENNDACGGNGCDYTGGVTIQAPSNIATGDGIQNFFDSVAREAQAQNSIESSNRVDQSISESHIQNTIVNAIRDNPSIFTSKNAAGKFFKSAKLKANLVKAAFGRAGNNFVRELKRLTNPKEALFQLERALSGLPGGGAVGTGITLGTSKFAALFIAKASLSTRNAGFEIGLIREALNGKKDFGLGTATRETAERLGRVFVGDGFKIASDGKTLLSADGLRQFRPPTFKPRLGITQANFERRLPDNPTKAFFSNGHLDIVDFVD